MGNANMQNMAEMAGRHGGDERDGKANRVAQYSTDDHLYVTGAGRVLEKDGGEFNIAPKQGYVKLHASIEADRKRFEASKAAMHQGKARDADGTVDRIDDSVSEKLMPLLITIKRRCEAENIDLVSVFEVRVESQKRANLHLHASLTTCHPMLRYFLRHAGGRRHPLWYNQTPKLSVGASLHLQTLTARRSHAPCCGRCIWLRVQAPARPFAQRASAL